MKGENYQFQTSQREVPAIVNIGGKILASDLQPSRRNFATFLHLVHYKAQLPTIDAKRPELFVSARVAHRMLNDPTGLSLGSF